MSRKGDKNFWECILTFLLKLFYSLLYHQFAWAYNIVAWIVSGGKWTEWVYTVLPLITGKQVLELGHGPGYLQVELSKKGYHIFGLDRSPQMIIQTQRRLFSHQFCYRLVRAAAEQLPFSSNSFDSVVTTFPTEYIFEHETIQEIWRVLKPHGKFIALVGVKIFPTGLYNRLLEIIYKTSRQDTPSETVLGYFLHHLNSVGLQGQIKWETTAGNQLLFVVCSKENTAN